MKIPIIATEQYPKGLGSTVSDIDTSEFKEKIFPKTVFSMVIPEVEEELKKMPNVKSVVLFGIEVNQRPKYLLTDIMPKWTGVILQVQKRCWHP